MHPDWELLASALYLASAHTCVPALVEDHQIVVNLLKNITGKPGGNTGPQCNIAATLCKVLTEAHIVDTDSSQLSKAAADHEEFVEVASIMYKTLQVCHS